jgi:LPPG:FO 2-phospho-L-lactate transferase
MSTLQNVVLLVGGVGGAKLALGLADILPAGTLTVIVNTADDFEHLGLHVSPDLDTVMYTLGGRANPQRGWGVEGDTFKAMEMVTTYGGASWFNLGDYDLGTNIYRTALLREGKTLSQITRQFCEALGIHQYILPMTDDTVHTRLDTVEFGMMDFQPYFVRERWQPTVTSIHFEGAEAARPASGIVEAIKAADALIIGPSNPFLSIDPILAIPGIRTALLDAAAPVVAVSPIVNSKALKGPAAKLMRELELDVSPVSVARHYMFLLNGFILDNADSHHVGDIQSLDIAATHLDTIMTTKSDKVRLAEQTINWIEEKIV